MTENLGDRIRKRRERHLKTAENVAETAKSRMEKSLKTYIDGKIAKLCADNGLIPPP